MEPALAKLSEEVVLLICLIFAPAGEKEVLIDVVGATGRQADLVALRTDSGFVVTEASGKDGKPLLRAVGVRNRPFVFDVKYRRQEIRRVDLSSAAKAVKAIRNAPKQRFKVGREAVQAVASGKIVLVNVQGMPNTFIVHGAGKADKPKTRPAGKQAGAEAARKFWAALAAGNTAAMTGMYAEKVLIKAGSELLWKEHAISKTGDRSKDAVADRGKVAGAYEHLIQGVGKTKWARIFSGQEEPIMLTIETAPKDGAVFGEVRKGDVILRPAPDSDEMIWVLRRDEAGRWRVVIEKFDI